MRIIRYVIDIVFPAITAFLAASDNAFNFLVQKNIISASFNIEVFQDICLLLNILFTTVILGGRIIACEYKQQANEKRIAGLYNMIKQFAQSNFEKISKNGNFNFEMRIFVKEKNLTHLLPKWIHKNLDIFFSIRNIYPFAHSDITENLRFRVCPEPQGLVGKCYADKSIYYDENLIETNNSYALNESQIAKTSELKWSICVPIFDQSNEIIAIVAFDSQVSKLSIEKNEDAIRKLVNTFSQMLYDCAPTLFKRKVVVRW